jgi:probable HAF family extracellular repeat protein
MLLPRSSLWPGEDGKMSDLGTLGGSFGAATAINEAGEVIGGARTAGDQALHAFIWKHGAMTDLGTVAGNDCSEAFGINSKGQVVGASLPCSVSAIPHAFLWEDDDIIDLNVFAPPASGLVIGDTEQINDGGEIFGSASLPNGDVRAVLLIPCDENHPGVEGCDYNEVEVTTEAPVRPAPTATSLANLSVVEIMMRYRPSMSNRYLMFGGLPLK